MFPLMGVISSRVGIKNGAHMAPRTVWVETRNFNLVRRS